MRIAEYKQISTEIITDTILVDDHNENGEVIGSHTETVTEEKPIMGLVYRDVTAEEESEAARAAEEAAEIEANREPTIEEQISDLTDLVTILTEVIAND